MANSGERVGIEAFLEEMVSLVDARLRKQEERIIRLERELKSMRLASSKKSRGEGTKIDKSVLKILRQ